MLRFLNRIKTLEIELPESCEKCGNSDFIIHGVRIEGKINVELRCMSCLELLSKVEMQEILETPLKVEIHD